MLMVRLLGGKEEEKKNKEEKKEDSHSLRQKGDLPFLI